MSSRRKFIQQSTLLAGGLITAVAVDPWAHAAENIPSLDYSELPLLNDDDFWAWVRSCFTTSSNIINLNNGGVSPQPKQVQDVHIKYYQWCNEAPTYYMWRSLDE